MKSKPVPISRPFHKESSVRAPLLNAEAGALIILGGQFQRPRKGVELLDFGADFINLTIFTNLGELFNGPKKGESPCKGLPKVRKNSKVDEIPPKIQKFYAFARPLNVATKND